MFFMYEIVKTFKSLRIPSVEKSVAEKAFSMKIHRCVNSQALGKAIWQLLTNKKKFIHIFFDLRIPLLVFCLTVRLIYEWTGVKHNDVKRSKNLEPKLFRKLNYTCTCFYKHIQFM